MSFYEDYFKLILKYANKYKPPKHNTKYSNSWRWRKLNSSNFLLKIIQVDGIIILI